MGQLTGQHHHHPEVIFRALHPCYKNSDCCIKIPRIEDIRDHPLILVLLPYILRPILVNLEANRSGLLECLLAKLINLEYDVLSTHYASPAWKIRKDL